MSKVRLLSRSEVTVLRLIDARTSAFADGVRKSLETQGFLALSHHGISDALLDRSYLHSARFFELPEAAKLELSTRDSEKGKYSKVGYFNFRSEQALSSKVPDIKEFYHIGPVDVSPEMQAKYTANSWPNESDVPGLRGDLDVLYRRMRVIGDATFLAVCRAFGIDEDYARDLVVDGGSILRLLHYPKIPDDVEPGATRAAQHTGIQLLGFQPRTTHAGLQFHLPTGEWVAVSQEQFTDCLLVNIGDMFQYMSGERAIATLHRVVNEMDGSAREPRYAIVYFYHANPFKKLRRFDGLSAVSTADNKSVGEWMAERFKALTPGNR